MANTFQIPEDEFLAKITALNSEELFFVFFRSAFHEGLLGLRRLELKGRVVLLDRPQAEHPRPYPIFLKFYLPLKRRTHIVDAVGSRRLRNRQSDIRGEPFRLSRRRVDTSPAVRTVPFTMTRLLHQPNKLSR